MNKKQKIIKILIILACFIFVAAAIYLPLSLSGTLNKIDSPEELKIVILNGGIYSYLIFFFIQFLQATILPIPAFVTTVAGTLVFGPWIATAISFVAVFLASIICFVLGKKFGKKLLIWVVGEQDAIKWQQTLSKGKYVFFLMMLFPFFPDDILCIVVGATTNISYKFFIITNLITRPISIACTAFIGSGQLIPYSGWGIPVWIVLIAIMICLFYISIKYQQQIENHMLKISHKLSKNKNNSKNTK